ncbi:DUF429 domain-containing protein [Thalassoglobus sp. JC818]|uniref:DUF429 domain-containing protein n=1 Tax=Thalassoglobus sp. JC818 TaxID=3232136 RepID=UPI003459F2F3
MNGNPPQIVVHADWGTDPAKRMMSVARRQFGHYSVSEATGVGDLGTFFDCLLQQCEQDETLLVGFDFPIGLAAAYCQLAGINSFRAGLQLFGQGPWADFYTLATQANEISIHRPFYPYAPGGTAQDQLVAGLGVNSMDDLLRDCDRATDDRANACWLFWTLGAKQVGRAAIIGWRDLIAPAIQHYGDELGIWPFDGRLNDLLRTKRIVICETYPAESYHHLSLSGGNWSKRRQEDRRLRGTEMVRWCAKRPVTFSDGLFAQLDDGFGATADGEDPFDAVVGVCSMLDVVTNYRSEGSLRSPHATTTDGWILGQL